jgi:hypothetical protein
MRIMDLEQELTTLKMSPTEAVYAYVDRVSDLCTTCTALGGDGISLPTLRRGLITGLTAAFKKMAMPYLPTLLQDICTLEGTAHTLMEAAKLTGDSTIMPPAATNPAGLMAAEPGSGARGAGSFRTNQQANQSRRTGNTNTKSYKGYTCAYCGGANHIQAHWHSYAKDLAARTVHEDRRPDVLPSARRPLQSTVSHSTTEAECKAASLAARDAAFRANLLTDLKNTPCLPVPLRLDNESAIKSSNNAMQSFELKHVRIARPLCPRAG